MYVGYTECTGLYVTVSVKYMKPLHIYLLTAEKIIKKRKEKERITYAQIFFREKEEKSHFFDLMKSEEK